VVKKAAPGDSPLALNDERKEFAVKQNGSQDLVNGNIEPQQLVESLEEQMDKVTAKLAEVRTSIEGDVGGGGRMEGCRWHVQDHGSPAPGGGPTTTEYNVQMRRSEEAAGAHEEEDEMLVVEVKQDAGGGGASTDRGGGGGRHGVNFGLVEEVSYGAPTDDRAGGGGGGGVSFGNFEERSYTNMYHLDDAEAPTNVYNVDYDNVTRAAGPCTLASQFHTSIAGSSDEDEDEDDTDGGGNAGSKVNRE
jgi:hypothetical protein